MLNEGVVVLSGCRLHVLDVGVTWSATKEHHDSKSDFAVDTVEPVVFFGLVSGLFSNLQSLVWVLLGPDLL